MAYVVDLSEREETGLGNLTPSSGASLGAAVRGTFGENASTLIYQAGRLRQANAIDLPRLPREEAEARVKAAGVKLTIPDAGYTEDALDLLIKRRRDAAALQSVQERTPWSWIGSPIRGGASLLTGVVDPLNVASAFVPVVREARAASMLERAGASALARAGARARIGVAEGAVGAAGLEPLVFGLHTQLQDDYGMADSLMNLAFGGLLGGGLHATVGAVADWRAPKVRLGDVTDVDLPPLVPRASVPGSAANQVAAVSPELREVAMRGAVADMAQGRAPDVDAVLRSERAGRVPDEADPELSRLAPERRAQLAAMYQHAERAKPAFDAEIRGIADEVGGTVKLADLKASKRAVDKALDDYGGDASKVKDLLRATIIADTAEGAQAAVAAVMRRFKVLPQGRRNLLDPAAKSSDGYRDAKFNVEVDGHVAEVQVNLPAMLDAKKQAHPLYKERTKLEREWAGQVMPPEVQQQHAELNARMREIYDPAWAEATSAANASGDTGAPLRRADSGSNTRGGVVSQASENGMPGAPGFSDTGIPSTSNSSALGPNAGSGTWSRFMTASEGILSENPASRAARHSAVAEPGAATAADQRLTAAPKDQGVEAAQAELDAATARLDDLTRNLEAQGVPRETTARLADAMKPFDEGIKDAKRLGDAVRALATCGSMT